MKKNFIILFILTLIFSFGCKKEESNYIEAAGVHISSKSATELDTQVKYEIKALNVKCTEIDVTGLATGTVTLTDGEGSFTASTDELDLSAAGDEATLVFTANTEGVPSYSKTVTMTDPISIIGLGDVAQTTEENKIYYSVSTVSATVESVKVETKVNSGNYTELTPDFDVAEDSICGIKGIDYNLNDTVYYKVTATAGTKTSVSETSFVIVSDVFSSKVDATLDFGAMGYDLVDAVNVEVETDTTDMEITTALGELGFEANNGTLFVVSDSATYADADVVVIKAAYEAGTKVTSVFPISKDDVFIYKTTREVGDPVEIIEHYGIIKISDFVLTTGGNKDGFNFSYKY